VDGLRQKFKIVSPHSSGFEDIHRSGMTRKQQNFAFWISLSDENSHLHPVHSRHHHSRLREFDEWEGELRHTTKEGREVIVSARKQLLRGADGIDRILETNRDITERKRSQEALLHSEKLASVGRMASTIAHEINNP
jgi:C4-dicarboxylate-specific signal transduction histidine kinase